MTMTLTLLGAVDAGLAMVASALAVCRKALGLKEGDEIEVHVTDGKRFGIARAR